MISKDGPSVVAAMTPRLGLLGGLTGALERCIVTVGISKVALL
ncbi:hypothetical protein WDV06_12690 [Streptomyces racemochromogenes]|uniref:Uncharacterized protein n=1 Tax=Streptomyces racemochromogenes TaxID=67353 RepID=A0ABW7PC44_9ACTN